MIPHKKINKTIKIRFKQRRTTINQVIMKEVNIKTWTQKSTLSNDNKINMTYMYMWIPANMNFLQMLENA